MSTKHITVIAVDVEDATSKNGKKYKQATVTHKDASGKVDNKKINDMFHKDVFETLVKAEKGDTFSVEQEKNDAGYWNWVAIHRQDAPVGQQAVPAKSFPTPTKPTYETPEERAQKQVYIIRQSSVASAVELLKDHGKQPDVAEVIRVAKAFETYVFGKTMEDLEDDIPE